MLNKKIPGNKRMTAVNEVDDNYFTKYSHDFPGFFGGASLLSIVLSLAAFSQDHEPA